MGEIREDVLKMLKKYPNGISRELLSLAVGTDDRTVRRVIRDLRRDHYPIGNGSKSGYTYGANPGLRKTIADMRCKALDLLTTASAMEKCLNVDGQESIELTEYGL